MKKTLLTRLLSILLMLTMMVSLCPAVFAGADGDPDVGFEDDLAEEPELTDDLGSVEDSGPEDDLPSNISENSEASDPAANPDPTEKPGDSELSEPVPAEELNGEDGQEIGNNDEDENEVPDNGENDDELVFSFILLHVVSAQDLIFTLSAAEAVVAPATEEEIAAYLASLGFEPPDDAAAEEDEFLFRADYLLAPGSYSWTAGAEGFASKTEALEITEETLWGTTLAVSLENSLPYGFKGMPEGYELSADELEKKQTLVDHDIVAALEQMEAGTDYVEGEILFLSDSEEYAEMVAEAYNADLCEFYGFFAAAALREATTLEAVTAAADMDLPLPAVEANQISKPEPDYGEARINADTDIDTMSGEFVNTRESWYSWYQSAGNNVDPFLKDPTQNDYQWMHDMVNTYEAWGVTRGAGVTIAVIDSGVQTNHPDFFDKTGNYGNVTGTGVMFSSSIEGYDHGTHVAGIIAAQSLNHVGGAGVAPEASIYSIGAASLDNGCIVFTKDALVSAIDSAIGTCQIINLSISGYAYSFIEEHALKRAVDSGITVVTAMGNDPTNIKQYPAAYNIPGLIAVGSVNEAGSTSSFSSYGPWLDVSAPGSAILSTVPESRYDYMCGTSMAAPVVAGVCALYLSQNPGAIPADVEKAVKKATTNGIVDASKLFIDEKTPPMIYLPGLDSGTADYGSWIYIWSGLDGDDIVYTLDGKTPTVKNGVVTAGTKYTGGIEITEENGFPVGKKVTVKAVRVNGMGTVSRPTSLTFTVGYAEPTNIVFHNLPEYVVAGKSVTLSASVFPEQAKQTVNWMLQSWPEGVSLDQKTGVLKTSAFSSGNVRVLVNSGSVFRTISFQVQQVNPVKTITLNTNNLQFWFSGSSYKAYTISPSATDAGGLELSPGFTYSSSNTKVVTVDDSGNVNVVGKGTAIITVKAQDGSNVSAKCSVQVKQLATSISVSGLDYVAPGKTAAYKAVVDPSYADNKAVTWSVSNNSYGITIDPKGGRLTVPSNVPSDIGIYIYADATDGSGIWESKYVEIQPLASKVIIYVDEYDAEQFGGNGYTYNTTTGALKQADLYSVETDYFWGDQKDWLDSSIQLSAASDAAGLVWSSSNPNVCVVDESGFVTAVAAGTATITCKAADAGGKKATAKIRVLNPASGVTVTSALRIDEDDYGNERSVLGAGKSAKNTVKLGDAFGKPSIAKVNWSVSVYAVDTYNDTEDEDFENYVLYKKWVTVNSSGTVSVKKDLKSWLDYYEITVYVTAETTDGTYLAGEVAYWITKPLTRITIDGYKSGIITLSVGGGAYANENDPFYLQGWYSPYEYYYDSVYTVKSSNPNVAGAVFYNDNEGYACVVVYSGEKKGTAKITITAADGSGKKATIDVKVY